MTLIYNNTESNQVKKCYRTLERLYWSHLDFCSASYHRTTSIILLVSFKFRIVWRSNLRSTIPSDGFVVNTLLTIPFLLGRNSPLPICLQQGTLLLIGKVVGNRWDLFLSILNTVWFLRHIYGRIKNFISNIWQNVIYVVSG